MKQKQLFAALKTEPNKYYLCKKKGDYYLVKHKLFTVSYLQENLIIKEE